MNPNCGQRFRNLAVPPVRAHSNKVARGYARAFRDLAAPVSMTSAQGDEEPISPDVVTVNEIPVTVGGELVYA